MPYWYPVWRHVDAGKATIGSVQVQFGFKGLRTVARQARYGHYVIEEIKPDAKPRLDPKADEQLAKRLQAMAPNIRIVQVERPPNPDRWQTSDSVTGAKIAQIPRSRKQAAASTIPLGQSPPTDDPAPQAPEAADLTSPPERVPTTVHRIIRDSELARRVKALHQHKCQICGHSIKLSKGSYYSEAHHIKPLGAPHNGPDVIGNILCVCPNHHAELDLRARQIEPSELTVVDGHSVAPKFIDYHNTKIFMRI